MVNIWIIVGEKTVGKSTAIRALTGVWRRDFVTLSAVAGYPIQEMLVMPRSLQEGADAELPQNFVKKVMDGTIIDAKSKESGKNRVINNVLICLREQQTGNFPGADDYISEFANAGWHIQVPVVHLYTENPQYKAPAPHITLPILGNPTPPNHVAHTIRQAWGWH